MSIPSTCRAAVFRGVGQPMEIQELRPPALEPLEALVEIECCTICGSDLHTVTGKRQERLPTVLGHESIGVIRQTGSQPPCDVRGDALQVGDRVTWSVAASCGECDRCMRGYAQKCRHLFKYGHEMADGRYALSGGLADHIVLRAGSAIVRVDRELSSEIICPVNCATATIAAALRVAGELSGRRVLIFGAGMLGLTAAAMAKSHQAASITIIDRLADRLDRGLAFGASSAVHWGEQPEILAARLEASSGTDCFDVILELSGAWQACEAAIGLGDVGAKVVLVGSVMPSERVAVDPEQVVRRCLSIYGVHNYAPVDLQSAVDFLQASHGEFPFESLVERRYKLDEVNEAIRFSLEQKPVRVAVVP